MDQLRSAGVSRDAQRRAVQRGLLFTSFTRVFSVGRPISHPRGARDGRRARLRARQRC